MIQANCRDRFTGDDFQFIVNALGESESKKTALIELLTDPETRDSILDDDCLFELVTGNVGFGKISPFLYFYVLTRRVFVQHNIQDRDLADYVACMLAQFCSQQRSQTISHQHDKPYNYLVDLVSDSFESTSFEAFLIRSHIGNHALFVTGIFPGRIYYKSTYGRKAPGFEYYEQMGRSSYRLASQHELATKFSLEETLVKLAEYFRVIRLALNKMSDNYISLDHRPPGLDTMLRQIFFGQDGYPSAEA